MKALPWNARVPWFPRVGTKLPAYTPKGFVAEVEESSSELFRVRVTRKEAGLHRNFVTFRKSYWVNLKCALRVAWVKRDLAAACEQFPEAEERMRKAMAKMAVPEATDERPD